MRFRSLARFAVILVLALVAGATALAQRGGGFGSGGFDGFRGFRPTYRPNVRYDGKFVFVRMAYPYQGRGGRSNDPPWAHDYPIGEEHFLKIMTAVTNLRAHVDASSVMSFDDPEMFKFPVIYLVEPGFWWLSDPEVLALRAYLSKGGFLIVDDFPIQAWPNFDLQMSRVFPQAQWHDLDATHPIFHTFFEINELPTVVPYGLGHTPTFRALFENNDPTKRMLVIANYQNDLSEYWESSDQGRFAVDPTNEAYKLGVNQFIYALTR
jgi:hypothetical protein